MLGFIRFADTLSAWFGKAFAWLIMMMCFATGYEVIVRYVFNRPSAWAFDVSFIMYGTLFMMGGAYTLSRNGHVRGDFLYRLWKPKTQATVDLILYIFFFFPGVTALIFSGWKYAERSWRFGEVSVNSPAGVPIYQFKTVMVAAGLLLFIQGIAQMMRCVHCIRTGVWLEPDEDVYETDQVLIQEAAQADKGAQS
jgi:TRAP-type mannitol/chloroaromatic compound transport system permease small subunit